MRPLYVHGLGLWTRGYPGLVAWCAQQRDPSAEKPEAELLEGPLRRRAPPLTRMSVEVLRQATAQAGCDPSGVRSVWATAHGEHTPAIKLLEMMKRGEGKLSPTHFHNSVHNTASGYASIATENRAPSTTLTGGSEPTSSVDDRVDKPASRYLYVILPIGLRRDLPQAVPVLLKPAFSICCTYATARELSVQTGIADLAVQP